MDRIFFSRDTKSSSTAYLFLFPGFPAFGLAAVAFPVDLAPPSSRRLQGSF
jgi:hypothetical protein